MELYPIAKHLHMTLAGLSLLGFLIRGLWMMLDSRLLQAKPTKIIPHVVDTFLLISAGVLVVITAQYPFVIDWVTLKLLLIIAYIVLGLFALKLGKTKAIKITCFVLAVVCFLGMFHVAMAKPVIF